MINNTWENNRIKIEKILDKYYYSNIKKKFSYMKNNFEEMTLVI